MVQAGFYQGTAAALIRMPSCPVCRWRERVLPHRQGEAPHPSCRVLRLPTLITDTEDVVATLEKEPLRTRSDMHKRPPKLWIDEYKEAVGPDDHAEWIQDNAEPWVPVADDDADDEEEGGYRKVVWDSSESRAI